MDSLPVHHLHVKHRGDVFTISHAGEAISLAQLLKHCSEIMEYKDVKKTRA